MVNAISPELGTEDPVMKDFLYDFLDGVSPRSAASPPVYEVYETFLRSIESSGEDLPLGLIEYMYIRSPSAALGAMMDVFQVIGERRDFLESLLSVVEPTYKRISSRAYIVPPSLKTTIQNELIRASNDEAWWVRLYAAEVITQRPVLGTLAIANILQVDTHPLVKQRASQFVPFPTLTRDELKQAIASLKTSTPAYQSALSGLIEDCTLEEVDYLLDTARRRGGWVILTTLGSSLNRRAARGEPDLLGHFVTELEKELERTAGARTIPQFVVGGLARAADLGPDSDPQLPRSVHFDRIVNIIMTCLDRDESNVRREAVRQLGYLVVVAPERAEEVTERLQLQRDREIADTRSKPSDRQAIIKRIDESIEKSRAQADPIN